MIRRCTMSWTGAFLLAVFTLLPVARAVPLMRVGIHWNPPKVAPTDSGQPEGIFVDLLVAIAEAEGWTLEYVPGTLAENLDRLAAGELDLVPDVARTPQREQRFAFHPEPVLTDWFQIYTVKGRGIRSVVDLAGKRVAVLKRSAQLDAFQNLSDRFNLNVTLVPMPDYRSAFTSVEHGAVDAVIVNRLYGAAHQTGHSLVDTAIVFSPTPLFFAASRSGDPSRLQAINRRLKEMKADPASAYHQSLRRWTAAPGPRFPYWLKAVLAGAAGLLLLSLLWSTALKHRVAARTRELEQQNRENEQLSRRVSESQGRFQILFDSNPVGMMLINRKTRTIEQVNSAAADLIGQPAGEITGRVCHGFLCPAEPHACPVCDLGQTLDRSEQILITADGRSVPVLKTAVPLTLDGTDCLLESFISIAERKRAEERLRFHAQLLDSVREAVVATDMNGRIQYWGRGAEQLYGYASDEVMGKPYREFAGPIDPPDEKAFKHNLATDGVWATEHRQKNRNGEVFWTSSFVSVVLDAEGQPAGFIGIDQDISKHKQTEQEQERLQLQLARAQKMESVGRLAGGVAYDFNNMLGIILGHAEIAMDGVPPEHPLHDNLKEIRTAAKRSADLTRQLLAFARKQTMAPRVLDLNQTVEGLLNVLRRLIGETIELTWVPKLDLGPVKMDPGQVDQILTTLCINARDAIQGAGNITIATGEMTCDQACCEEHAGYIPGDYVLLSVRDTGCGMDRETLARLFEPFFSTKGAGRGSGLGLSTVYGIVKQNKGFIDVDSEPGSGTTLKIFLPRFLDSSGAATAPEPAQAPKPETPAKPAKAPDRGKVSVLVVEDEPAILQITQTMLSRMGYHVVGVATPAEAIHLAETHSGKIDMLMTDVLMPEMNGRDLSKALSAYYPDMKCLFMSGYTSDVIVYHDVLHEGIEYIQKPFLMKELEARVRKVLGHPEPGPVRTAPSHSR